MPRPKCNSCYYLGQQQIEPDEPTNAVCRRNAPMPIPDDADITHAKWPIVSPDVDWCGDHHWNEGTSE